MADFAYCLPAWTINGLPISWAHYVYGIAFLRRKQAREELSFSNSIRMAKAKEDDFRVWRSELRMIAGY